MAKKKTAGPDSIPNPAANRRRAPKKADAATEQTSAIAETFDAGGSVEAADDRGSGSAAVGSGNGASGTHGPSYEEIAQAAYQRYLERGGDHGRDYEDWLEAERELRSRR
jgi:hypothetical protein